jgi:hypothetical protein
VRCVLPGPLTGRFNAVCTLSIADSIGDMGRKAEMAGMWPGTRSEPANLAAIHRGHKPLQTCCCTRLHIRQRPKLVRQEQKLQRGPQSKQSGSSWRLLVVLSARVNIGSLKTVPLPCSDPSCRRFTLADLQPNRPLVFTSEQTLPIFPGSMAAFLPAKVY